MDRLDALPPDLQCRIWGRYTLDVLRGCLFELNLYKARMGATLARDRRRGATLMRDLSRVSETLWEASFALRQPRDPFGASGEEFTLWYKTINFERGRSDAQRVEHWLDLDMKAGPPPMRTPLDSDLQRPAHPRARWTFMSSSGKTRLF